MIADFIGLLEDDIPLEALLEVLHDPESVTREAAIHALKPLGTRVPMEALLAMLGDEEIQVCQTAAKALQAFGDRVPVEMLLPLLRENDARVALTVAKLGGQEGIDMLVKALCNFESCWNAAKALGELGTKAPAAPLVAALGNSKIITIAAQALYQTHPKVCQEIALELSAVLLGEQTGQYASILDSSRHTTCAYALAALQSAAPPFITYLADLLEWPYWETRSAAFFALGEIGRDLPPQTIEMMERLQSESEPTPVRKAATNALQKLSAS